MKAKWLSLTAAAAFCAAMVIASQAEAQRFRGMGGGAMRMASFSGGAFRGAVAPRYVGGGFRSAIGPRFVRAGGPIVGPRHFARPHFHHRRHFAFGAFPFIAAAALTAPYAYTYDDGCPWRKVWTYYGWQWQRYCEYPYAYGY